MLQVCVQTDVNGVSVPHSQQPHHETAGVLARTNHTWNGAHTGDVCSATCDGGAVYQQLYSRIWGNNRIRLLAMLFPLTWIGTGDGLADNLSNRVSNPERANTPVAWRFPKKSRSFLNFTN